MTALEVVEPGLRTLVQDAGRAGWAHVGVGRSGAADAAAWRLANRLVANPQDAAGLELLLGGVRLRALGPVTVALAGAPAAVWVDRTRVGMHAVVEVPDGAVLRVGAPVRGLRTYLAVRGGFAVEPVLGSRSADVPAGLGPAPLVAGDVLPVGAAPTALPLLDVAPVRPWPDEVVLPVLPGPRADWFVDDALDVLCGAVRYQVTPSSDRVALRLDGPALLRAPHAVGRELPSEGLVPGAVQVPPDGRPVVFGADHPVTGGYPVLAVVRSRALGVLGQLRPGEPVRFVRG